MVCELLGLLFWNESKTVNPDSIEVIQVAKEIKRYLNRHPHAADTSEGVVQWLARQRYEDTLELVHKALEVLVDQEVVLKTLQGDGTVLFKRLEKSQNYKDNIL